MRAASHKRKFKPPEWAWGELACRMTGVVKVLLFGYHYELPVTPDTEPFLALLRGEVEVWPEKLRHKARRFRREQSAEHGMRDILQAIYIQMRDTVGAEVSRDLGQEIQTALEPLIHGKVMSRIEKKAGDGSPSHRLMARDGRLEEGI